MFVLRSKYMEALRAVEVMEQRLYKWERAHSRLVDKWNDLVKKVNAKGGLAALEPVYSPLSKKDLNKMLSLCHPDKHDNKNSAKEITQKLLTLRAEL